MPDDVTQHLDGMLTSAHLQFVKRMSQHLSKKILESSCVALESAAVSQAKVDFG